MAEPVPCSLCGWPFDRRQLTQPAQAQPTPPAEDLTPRDRRPRRNGQDLQKLLALGPRAE